MPEHDVLPVQKFRSNHTLIPLSLRIQGHTDAKARPNRFLSDRKFYPYSTTYSTVQSIPTALITPRPARPGRPAPDELKTGVGLLSVCLPGPAWLQH